MTHYILRVLDKATLYTKLQGETKQELCLSDIKELGTWAIIRILTSHDPKFKRLNFSFIHESWKSRFQKEQKQKRLHVNVCR